MASRTPSPEQSTAASSSQHQPGPATYTRAPKGKACLNCRRRKLKCDCAHPVCNQCVRFGRERDCEYPGKDQRCRSEILEEQIAALQARIRQLEGGSGVAPSGSSFSLGQDVNWAGSAGNITLNYPMSVQLPEGRDISSPLSNASLTEVELTPTEARALVEAFLPHALDVGFFLYTPRFLSRIPNYPSNRSPGFEPYSILSQRTDGSDFLLSVIYLWGAVITSDEVQKTRESFYLARALKQVQKAGQQCLATSFGTQGNRPNVVHLIQSHVLLANYFFYSGQFLEGRRHISDAVSLVSFYNMHKIRSSRSVDPSHPNLVTAVAPQRTLNPPADLVEEGERIHAFWHVYILDKVWSALLGCPSLLVEDGSPASEIDTPWPLPMEQYVEGVLPIGYGSTGRTCQTFVSTHDVHATTPMSPVDLRAKTAALLSRAVWLSSTCAEDLTMQQIHARSFEMIDELIDKTFLALPRIDAAKEQYAPDVLRHVLVTHCLTRMAMYRLHHPFFGDELKSAMKTMSACKTVIVSVGSVPAELLATADPMLSVLLTMPMEVVTDELVRITSQHINPPKRQLTVCDASNFLAAHLDETVDLITRVNPGSKLTALQLEATTAIRSALAGTAYGSPSRS